MRFPNGSHDNNRSVATRECVCYREFVWTVELDPEVHTFLCYILSLLVFFLYTITVQALRCKFSVPDGDLYVCQLSVK